MSVPPYVDVRKRIENVPETKHRMFLKALYLLGIARPAELVSQRNPHSEGNVIYGPTGKDVRIEEIDMPEPSLKQIPKLLSQIENKELDIKEVRRELSLKVQIALFKIKLSKMKREPNKEIPYRLVGLPINNQFEDSWTKEVYDYFKKAGSNYVFPFKRFAAWYYVKYYGIFKDLDYVIRDYIRTRKTISGTRTEPVGKHERKILLEGLRHVRRAELIKEYGFGDLDWAAFTGAQIRVLRDYFTVQEDWHRYIKKLCQKSSFIVQPKLSEFK